MKALLIAFSMYSRLPVPDFIWEEEDRKKAMCFFPLVGVIQGLVLGAFVLLCRHGEIGGIARALVCTALPVIVNGGIHMDGFLDTVDARHSYKSREEKLEILKDPHAGAFAIIWCGVYFMLYAAAMSQAKDEVLLCMGLIYTLTRALSGFSVVTFPCAKKSGLAASFVDGAQKRTVRIVMVIWFILCAGLLIFFAPLSGILGVAAALCVFAWYYHMSQKEFGGITGDLAGFFLQTAELFCLFALVLGNAS